MRDCPQGADLLAEAKRHTRLSKEPSKMFTKTTGSSSDHNTFTC